MSRASSRTFNGYFCQPGCSFIRVADSNKKVRVLVRTVHLVCLLPRGQRNVNLLAQLQFGTNNVWYEYLNAGLVIFILMLGILILGIRFVKHWNQDNEKVSVQEEDAFSDEESWSKRPSFLVRDTW